MQVSQVLPLLPKHEIEHGSCLHSQVVSTMVDDAIRQASDLENCEAHIRTRTFLALLNDTPSLYDTVVSACHIVKVQVCRKT
jgi:hypothetical protein